MRAINNSLSIVYIHYQWVGIAAIVRGIILQGRWCGVVDYGADYCSGGVFPDALRRKVPPLRAALDAVCTRDGI
ncbi:MAG TPA: hypothetical protein VGL07_17890 [Buttiauxella sp.]